MKIPPRLRLLRFTLAWVINLISYTAACLIVLIYGALFEAPAFNELLLAWVAALVFTWLVIEPAEVLGLVLLPSVQKNGMLMSCRQQCKDLGFY